MLVFGQPNLIQTKSLFGDPATRTNISSGGETQIVILLPPFFQKISFFSIVRISCDCCFDSPVEIEANVYDPLLSVRGRRSIFLFSWIPNIWQKPSSIWRNKVNYSPMPIKQCQMNCTGFGLRKRC